MTRRPARWAIVTLALMTASCSGGDEAADDTSAAPSTAAPSTTAAVTTAPPRTTPATTTAAPSTPPTTTPATTAPTAPPTTALLDPIADLAAALQRDAQAGEDTLFAVLSDPNAPDAEARLGAFYVGKALETTLGTLAEFRENNFVAAPNPDVPVTILITGPASIEAGSDPPRAIAQTCRLDAAWVMALSDNGLLVPFNTTVYRTDAMSTFVLVDGVWRLEGGDLISESEGASTCA